MTDLDFMKMAYRLAQRGKTTVSPNPLVGAVIVRNNKVIAWGFHRRCGGPHAEIIAMKNVKGSLAGAKLYVTLEPCCHFGRTPPCVDAVIKSGIKEVIVGMIDPNPLTNGKAVAKLRKAGIEVKVGVFSDELTKMNEAFIKYIKRKMPFVVAKVAQTIDGKIATRIGESKWITSAASRKYAHEMRNEFDAILVGINTVLKDDPGLNVPTKQIKKIVVDSALRISLKAKLFKNTQPQQCFIATTKKADKQKAISLRKRGVNVVVCPQKAGRVDLKWLMKEMARNEIVKILVEGGGQIIGSALRDGLVDKIMVFVAPKIIGDQSAVSSIDGGKVSYLGQAVFLRDLTCRRIDEDFLFEAYIK